MFILYIFRKMLSYHVDALDALDALKGIDAYHLHCIPYSVRPLRPPNHWLASRAMSVRKQSCS